MAKINRILPAVLLSVVTIIVVAIVLVFATGDHSKPAVKSCYRAAVLDHVPQFNPNDPLDVLKNIELNFKIYVDAARIAQNEHADIIVFPEEGLIFPIGKREQALKFSTNITNKPNVVLCQNEHTELNMANLSIVRRLSCLARLNQIYLIANVLDRQPCDNGTKDCPKDGQMVFNTNVLFDRNGRLLAKYHKMHPFGEMLINHPPHDELIWVETEDLGRLGLQICFDIIFEKPGHTLVEKHAIDTMIFPTQWFDEAPLLSATQVQFAWALGNHVNLLASDIHHPSVGTLGSGIYSGGNWPHFLVANFFNETGRERLLLADVPIKPRSVTAQCDSKEDRIIEIPVKNMLPESSKHHYIQMDNTNISLVALDTDQQVGMETQHNGVICRLDYQANFALLNLTEGKYFLIASNRTRPNPSYQWSEEFCAVTYCRILVDNNHVDECHEYSTNDFQLFNYLKLNAIISDEATIYPNAVGFHHTPISMENVWHYGLQEKDVMNENKTVDDDKSQRTRSYYIEFGSKDNYKNLLPLTTLSLYGRAYRRDPPYRQNPVSGKKTKLLINK